MAEQRHGADPSTGTGPVEARLRPLRSVRARITLAAALVTAAAMAVTGWLLVQSVEDSQLGAIRNDTEILLDQVSERLAAGVPPEETLNLDPEERIKPDELITRFVEIEYEDGTVVNLLPTPLSAGAGAEDGLGTEGSTSVEPTPSDEFRADSSSPPPGPGAPKPGDDAGARPGALSGGTDNVQVIAGFPLEQRTRTVDTPSGEATVTVAAPLDQVAHSLDAVRRALTIGLALLVGLVALAAWWLVGRALRPVERIRAEADAIGASTLHRRVSEPGTGDEVHRLSRTMNAMLERLEGAVRRQRQFVADASHELRNPVAGIRTDLEVALCEGDRADWPTVAQAVLAEEARLETLIGDLLVLAAEDEGAGTLPETNVDLTELAANEARRSRKVPVSSTAGSDGVVVVGSRNQLQRALANLVDNAERHAHSQVRIGTSARAGWAQLWVDDDGPGVPRADRDRVFERFTRLDDSRARDHGGSGLGLAVVRSIVTRHRGSVWAEDSSLGGARFVIVLPPRKPSAQPHPRQDLTALHQDRPTTTPAPWPPPTHTPSRAQDL